jgi:hypothetical protein
MTKALSVGAPTMIPANLNWYTGIKVFQKDNVPEHYIDGTIILTTKSGSGGMPLLYIITFMPRDPALLDV